MMLLYLQSLKSGTILHLDQFCTDTTALHAASIAINFYALATCNSRKAGQEVIQRNTKTIWQIKKQIYVQCCWQFTIFVYLSPNRMLAITLIDLFLYMMQLTRPIPLILSKLAAYWCSGPTDLEKRCSHRSSSKSKQEEVLIWGGQSINQTTTYQLYLQAI